MVLFHPIVQVLVRPVYHFAAPYPSYRMRIRVMAVGGYLGGLVSDNFPGLLEELLGRSHISLLR